MCPSAYYATYGDAMNKYLLPENVNGIWTWDTETVGNAGIQTHKAKYTPFDKNNYESREVLVTFSIAKKVVQLPIINSKTYNGTCQKADIVDTNEYKVCAE